MKKQSQETLEYEMKKQMETFLNNPPINLLEEGKRLLAVNSFEAINSVFIIIYENSRFSISTPKFWNPNGGKELVNKLNNLVDLRPQNDIELQVEEVEKRGSRIEVENSGLNLASLIVLRVIYSQT